MRSWVSINYQNKPRLYHKQELQIPKEGICNLLAVTRIEIGEWLVIHIKSVPNLAKFRITFRIQ